MKKITIYKFKGEPKHLLSRSKKRFDDKGYLEIVDDGSREKNILINTLKNKQFKFTKTVYTLTKKVRTPNEEVKDVTGRN